MEHNINDEIDEETKRNIHFLYKHAPNMLKLCLKEYNEHTEADEKTQNYIRKLLKLKQ